MKTMSILFLVLLASLPSFAATDSNEDLVQTAKAVTAIIAKGHSLARIYQVQKINQMSVPAQKCLLITYERIQNTRCPDEFGQGPFLDKAWLVCFETKTNDVISVLPAESKCSDELSE